MYALGQRFLVTMATRTTVLRGIRWVDCDELPTSICCFVGEKHRELGPRRILNAFGEAVMVHHRVDGQIFHGYHIESLDETVAFLVRKVGAPIGNPLMDSADDLAACPAFRRALDRRRQLALRAL